jgi:hypothetical protein
MYALQRVRNDCDLPRSLPREAGEQELRGVERLDIKTSCASASPYYSTQSSTFTHLYAGTIWKPFEIYQLPSLQ